MLCGGNMLYCNSTFSLDCCCHTGGFMMLFLAKDYWADVLFYLSCNHFFAGSEAELQAIFLFSNSSSAENLSDINTKNVSLQLYYSTKKYTVS